MIRTIKTIVILLAAMLLAWALPWCYNFIFSSPWESPLTLYSCVNHDFVTFSFDGDDDVAGYDTHGNTYDEKQFDSIMPTVFCRRLAESGRLPAQIDGKEFVMHDVERSSFVFRISPSDLHRPETGLYLLLESAPGRNGFSIPDDVFRITDRGIEFVRMNDNRIDIGKSVAFTDELSDKGFVFPASAVAGNSSTRKPYDNGYLLIDATGAPFVMKQIHGKPFVRRIAAPASVKFTEAFVTEYPDRRLLGFLCDDRGDVYAIEKDDRSLHRLPIDSFDDSEERMIIVGDMFCWTVIVERKGYEKLTAIDSDDYSTKAVHEIVFPEKRWESNRGWLFPFRLAFTASSDRYIKPRIRDFSARALCLNLILAAAYLFCRRRTEPDKPKLAIRTVGVLLLGIYLLIPLLFIGRRE